jgi:hypothetical protein
MRALIEFVSHPADPVWLVHACGMSFHFTDQQSASTFASKLEERVNARHVLPQEALQHRAAASARDRSAP